jgi:hypothetical protein
LSDLPPEDQPENFDSGPIQGISIHFDDDPRFEADRLARTSARQKAQAMHTVDDLLAGLMDDDWRVRHEVVDRLIARGVRTAALLPY